MNEKRSESESLVTWLGAAGTLLAVVVISVWVSGGISVSLTPTEWLAAALVLVNLILAGITFYYARQAKSTADYTWQLAQRTGDMAEATQSTVQEMRESRQLSIRPKLALNVHMIDPDFGVITVTNIGQGTALDVKAKLELTFKDGASQTRDLLVKTFLSNERHQYLPKHPGKKEPLEMEDFALTTTSVRLSGVMKDVYDDEYEVADDLDVWEVWSLMTRAERRITEDPLRTTSRELEAIRKWLQDEFHEKPKTRDEYGPDEAPF
ncbi:MAG: phage holin family protein [Actinomycetota bacterium]